MCEMEGEVGLLWWKSEVWEEFGGSLEDATFTGHCHRKNFSGSLLQCCGVRAEGRVGYGTVQREALQTGVCSTEATVKSTLLDDCFIGLSYDLQERPLSMTS
jgi:hypothetical protein